jgi:hypothetical protein
VFHGVFVLHPHIRQAVKTFDVECRESRIRVCLSNPDREGTEQEIELMIHPMQQGEAFLMDGVEYPHI